MKLAAVRWHLVCAKVGHSAELAMEQFIACIRKRGVGEYKKYEVHK